jgi:sulfur-carrier protein
VATHVEPQVIRLELPYHLRQLASLDRDREVTVVIEGPVTQRSVLDTLEARHPALRGTIRDQATRIRRPYIRLYACRRDLSHEPPDALLPDEVVHGLEPLLIIGALAGG